MESKIKPGYMVALKTHVRGGVRYERSDLPAAGEGTKRWETTRTIDDPAEWERAKSARSLAQSAVCCACVRTDFGLVCPADKKTALDAAVAKARALVAEHNASARSARVELHVLTGRVDEGDADAQRAVLSEVRDLLDEMGVGKAEGDVERIRAAAGRARAVSALLAPELADTVMSAVAEARAAAKEIVRTTKSGEDAEVVARGLLSTALDAARVAMLDAVPEEVAS